MPEIRYSILRWWAQETRVSPNKNEVARKRLELGIYNNKPIRFVIETQVCLWIQVCWLSLGLFSSRLMKFW